MLTKVTNDAAAAKDKANALLAMDRIAAELNDLEKKQRDLRIAYWGHQARVYPVYECHHDSAHFCANCAWEASTDRDA